MRERVTNNSQRITNNNKKVVRSKLSVVSPFIGTFHSFGAKILRAEAARLGRNIRFTIFDNDDSLRLLRNILKASSETKERFTPPKVLRAISKVKSKLLDPNECLEKGLAHLYESYEATLTSMNGFDFDDLIEKVVQLFRRHPDILEKYRARFRHILVDEYQDVNTAQYELVRLLAKKHQNLSVVGDDAQAIYGWRHADFRCFLNFERDWPGARVVKLEESYRSSGNIIRAASALIATNKLQKEKDLWTANPPGEPITVVATADPEEEASFIADAIKEMLKSYADAIVNQLNKNEKRNSSTVAVLYRTNAQSRAIEQALIDASLPYRIFGGVKFYERAEVKDIVAAVRLAVNPKDMVSAERLEKHLPAKTGRDLIAGLRGVARGLPPLELIKFFLERSDYFSYLERTSKNAEERIENIHELTAFAAKFQDANEFLERVALMQSIDQPDKNAGTKKPLVARGQSLAPISLMTIHLAKGLEFDHVFVAGVAEGILPHQMSYGSHGELEEERRLLYVAMTRAKHLLTLSFSRLASQFLYEIPADLTNFLNLAGTGEKFSEDENIVYLDD